MSKRDEQIARMRGLMTYGISNTSKKTPVTESIEGPDGNVYAIIREGTKFYIKSTPKGSELVAESFDYIGGFMNKKNNEFSSYNQASKNLELKVRSLNEAYGVNKTVELLNPEKKESLMVEMTESMKESLARYRQIMNNAAGIMKESATISASNTGNPEAPKTTSFSPKLGEPFTDTADAKLDKDLKATAKDPEKQGEPFGDNSKVEKYKDAQYVPDNSVANKKPSGGKVVRVNENEEFEETIEECEEWGSCGLPASAGVGEVGDDAPFTQGVSTQLEENNFFHNPDVADGQQLADTPDEVTLDEDAEEFVGFADEDNSIEENEDEDEINLDDIDLDLDSDEMPEEELDDVDTEETLDDEGELEDEEPALEDETSEVEALRSEVEELRRMVQELMGNAEPTVEPEANETMVDSDDFDVEGEEEPVEESCQVNESLLHNKLPQELPFEVNVRWDELQDIKSKYSFPKRLEMLAKKYNASPEDMKLVYFLRGRVIEMLELDYTMKTCVKNNYFDEEVWDTLSGDYEKKCSILQAGLNKLQFIKELSKNEFDNIELSVEMFFVNGEQLEQKYEAATAKPEEPMAEPENDAAEEAMNRAEQNDAEYYADEEGFEELLPDTAGEGDFDDDFNDMDNMYESKKTKRINEEGTKLNVFGKHPGYRKKPMSLPQTGSDKVGEFKDWNDDSVYSEQPFGEKIGSSAPFDKIIEESINAVLAQYKKKL